MVQLIHHLHYVRVIKTAHDACDMKFHVENACIESILRCPHCKVQLNGGVVALIVISVCVIALFNLIIYFGSIKILIQIMKEEDFTVMLFIDKYLKRFVISISYP